ncbi:MAG TPA: hypothetical protein VLA68_07135, partial [Nitrososphaera sp.]|nr:hypothetical protein [Nitrososphaera sp.]
APMNYFGQHLTALAYGTGARFIVGCVLVSLGILLAAGGGSWDITNHLLNKPETFFAPPHAILYTGAGTAVVGAALLFFASRSLGKVVWSAKLAVAGVALLVSAGPVDFAWHTAFGLDGLLSPPHFVLVSGMVLSSLGALAGMVHYNRMKVRRGEPVRLHIVFIVIGILPLWLSLSGMIDMFTLPFSNTAYFNFDPDRTFAVAFASVGFPFLIAACLCTASVLAGRRFGALSITGGAFVLTSILTSIIPSEELWPTIQFYMLNIIPIVAMDAILSYRYWRPFRIPLYAAGAVAGLTFFMLYFPLITHTYNEFTHYGRLVWPSVTAAIYFEEMAIAYPYVAAPAASMGVLGALAADRLAGRNKDL